MSSRVAWSVIAHDIEAINLNNLLIFNTLSRCSNIVVLATNYLDILVQCLHFCIATCVVTVFVSCKDHCRGLCNSLFGQEGLRKTDIIHVDKHSWLSVHCDIVHKVVGRVCWPVLNYVNFHIYSNLCF